MSSGRPERRSGMWAAISSSPASHGTAASVVCTRHLDGVPRAQTRGGLDGVPAWAMDSLTSPPGATADTPGWDLRPMALEDVEATMAVVEAADAALAKTGLLPPPTAPSDAQLEASRVGHARFVRRDGPGAWVAVSEGRVVGVAESVRRENFWGLSMLFVHPEFQSRGVGGRLLEAAGGYAAGATQRMIQSSPDPRAMRRYFLAGLAMHPAAEMRGQPDRRAIPHSLPGRSGDERDLELVAEVEAQLGRSRTEDVAFAVSHGHYRF